MLFTTSSLLLRYNFSSFSCFSTIFSIFCLFSQTLHYSSFHFFIHLYLTFSLIKMVLETIFTVLVDLIKTPIAEYVVSPIKRHLSYAFQCDRQVQNLEDAVVQLKNKKDRLEKSVDKATRNGEEIYDNVTGWLSSVKNEVDEAEQLIHGKDEAKKKCCVGVCPNLKTHYQLSKKADKKASVIGTLVRDAEGFDPISFFPPLQQIVEPSVYTREALASRVLILDQIMDALKDPNLYTVGVCGMGGVGKTTLAKEVQAKAMQEKMFETVVLVAVSQTPELKRIQTEIAEFLGLKFEVEEIPGRASQLYKRLKKSKVLIILDDLWHKLDLNAIGIPSGESCKGCKLLLTSRRMDVLCIEMEIQKEFSLGVLGEDEAWTLFQKIAAKSVDPQFYAIATEVAKKCAGLPLLIIIVAKELRNKELYSWVDMLKQLSVFGNEEIHKRVHKVLESSFENLPGEEIKSFFLLCSLFAQSNIQIQCLLIYSMGLGLFKHTDTIQDARNRLFTLINKLKAECLLLDGDKDGFVKMHDVVRDAAISIASRLQHAFVGAGQVRLRDCLDQKCTKISLPYCNVCELPKDLECPKADLFLLFTEDLCLEIPDSFFEGIRKLKVVDFTGMRLVSLPLSLGLLTNLHTLSLHECRLNNVAVIGELKQLELLSFADSEIVELPREIEELTQLKLLDLSNCSMLRVIPANFFSKLGLLEELYMLKSFDRWDTKGNVSLVELESLSHLSTLEIQIVNPKLIPKCCRFFGDLQLHNFKISIGDEWGWEGKYETPKTLKLKLESGVQLEHGIEVLLRGAEDLYLDEPRGINLDGAGFSQLKHLHIQNDSGDIQHLIQSKVRASCQAWSILESLYLKNLKSLEKICDGQLATGSFGKLQKLNVEFCRKLKSLLSFSSAKCLSQLEELGLRSCDNMEAVVGDGIEDGRHNNEAIEFTQLKSLKLQFLSGLKYFCRKEVGTAQMKLLFNEMVSFPNLTSLELYKCKSLNCVFSISMVKCLVQLKRLEIQNCELVEEIMPIKKFEEIEEECIDKIVFPELDYLKLGNLPNLKRFCCGHLIEFPSLKTLSMSECPAMENFASKFSSRSHNNASDEYFFNEMVSFPNLERMDASEMDSFRYLWDEKFILDDSFFKLKSLTIRRCSKLQIIFPLNVYRRFKRLETLTLSYCGGVEEIYQYEGVDFEDENIAQTFALRDLEISSLRSLIHIWSKDYCTASAFGGLQSVSVFGCEDLKYVFPDAIACNLVQLQRLNVRACGVEMIIAKRSKGGPLSFEFPELTFLGLVHLNEMRSLYEGSHTLVFPKLKILEVLGCHELMKYGSKISPHGEDKKGKDNLPTPQSLFLIKKLIPGLEKLTIDNHGLKAIHQSGVFPAEFCSNVKNVNVKNVEEESIHVLFGFLKRLNSVEKLVFKYGSLEEISLFGDERAAGEEEHYPRLKHLTLRSLHKLKHIVKKDSQLNYVLQYLQTLSIKFCDNLMDIALPSTSFQHLTTLCLYFCDDVTKLVTSSTAKTMAQLVQMKVVHCEKMEEVIANDTDFTEHDVINFNKLKCLELINLRRISSFCSGNYTINFPLLEQVTVKSCSQMKNFCGGVLSTPKLRGILHNDEQQWEGDLNTTIASQLRDWVGGRFVEGRLFQNIESMKMVKDAFSSKVILANQLQFLNRLKKIIIRDCDLVQAAFDLEGLSIEDGDTGFLPKLNELHLINLPVLSRLCSKPPVGVLDFNKLRVLKIENCGKLVHVFTWSMASCLAQLYMIELRNCELVERIIKAEVDDASKVILRSLHSVVLKCLPKFSGFYSGNGDLECPSLVNISIRECPSIKAFISTLPREDRKGKNVHNIHFRHKVFPSLKKLSLDIKSIVAILQFELPNNFFMNAKELTLGYCSVKSTRSYVPLLHFLSRLPNLDEFEIRYSFVNELFKLEGLNSLEEDMTLPQIKSLKLQNIADVKHILWHNSQVHASLSQSLKTLKVVNCGNLIYLASSSTSFQNLTTLEVYSCNQLIYLLTSSVAKSMAQLEKLCVKSCELLMEILGNGNDGTFDDIVFTEMKTLELSDLQSLQSFSSGHCSFKFPCLENVILTRCPNLKFFCAGTSNAPMLYHVKHGGISERRCYWKGDINATIQQLYWEMVGFEDLQNIQLTIFPMLKQKWGDQIPFKYFRSLTKLVVDDCPLLSNAISLNLLRQLECLEELKVEKCESVEQVYDLDGLDAYGCGMSGTKELKQLQLIDLPSLRHVWSKDPQQNLSFKNLQLLKIQNCGNLTYIFDLSMASRLPKLEHVEVKNCSSVEHIIVKAEEETMQECRRIFPSLLSLSLQHLTNLSSFYSTTGFLEFPSLKVIEVLECPKMELFPSRFSNGQPSCMDVEDKEERISCKDPNSQPAFLGNQIAVPGLEELKVKWSSLMHIFRNNNQPELLSRLKLIELTGFHGEYGILPPNFLQYFPKLGKLSLSDALIEEINLYDSSSLKGHDPESDGLLTKLKLSKLPKLKHLVRDDFSQAIVFQNLEDFEVVECSRLKILVPSSASFQNLTNLQVTKCDAMVNLITSSTASSLVQLKKMNVKECKMMREIVAIGSDGVGNEICFSQLECLGLDDLPCLESFCSGNYDLYFPSLEEVVVIGCPNMKTFACSVAPKLKKVKTGRQKYEWEWEGNLNNTIQALHAEKDAEELDARTM